MATHILDPETMSDPTGGAKHKALLAWVEGIAQLCKPDRVFWCDGSDDEYQAMTRLMAGGSGLSPTPAGAQSSASPSRP